MNPQKILFRLIASPFVLVLIILAAIRYVIREFISYLRYGGELIFYSKEVNPTTFSETIHKIIKENETNNHAAKQNE
jgi:hypothetical protein